MNGGLSRDGVIARYFISASLFLLPLTGMVSGYAATISGVMAVVELATALTRYSPLGELKYFQLAQKRDGSGN